METEQKGGDQEQEQDRGRKERKADGVKDGGNDDKKINERKRRSKKKKSRTIRSIQMKRRKHQRMNASKEMHKTKTKMDF